jgi:subtilisin family serine protease
MYRLQVIVPALNKRRRLPASMGDKDSIAGVVLEGFSFIGEEVDPAERLNLVNDKWYKDRDGYFYWGGGLLVIDEFISPAARATAALPGVAEVRRILAASQEDINKFLSIAHYPSEVIDFHQLVHLPMHIKQEAGVGIKIAVLDTGVENRHLDLDNKIISSRDFTGSAFGATDVIGHGTSMASLIAAKRFFNDKGISGVAPQAEIIAAKVMYEQNNPGDFLSVGQGINYAVDQKADIINLSIGRKDKVQAVADIITNAATNKNTILVGATKQYNQSLPLLQFPCNCPEVIAVSAMPKDFIVANWDRLPTPLIIVPNNQNWTCSIENNNYYLEDAGSSVATAIISGIIALILSNQPTIVRTKTNILFELAQYASTIEEAYTDLRHEICFVYKP